MEVYLVRPSSDLSSLNNVMTVSSSKKLHVVVHLLQNAQNMVISLSCFADYSLEMGHSKRTCMATV